VITYYKCTVEALIPHPCLDNWNEVRLIRRLLIDSEEYRAMHLKNWWYFYNHDPLDAVLILHKVHDKRISFHLNPGGSRFIGMALRDNPKPLDGILVSPDPLPVNSHFKGMQIDYSSETKIKGKWGKRMLAAPFDNDWCKNIYHKNRDGKTSIAHFKNSRSIGHGLYNRAYELILHDGSSVVLNRELGEKIIKTYHVNSFPSFTDCVKTMFREVKKDLRSNPIDKNTRKDILERKHK